MVGHTYKRCEGHDHCPGCKHTGHDCLFEVLSTCLVCGGSEGELLPTCPGRILTAEEHEFNYEHFNNWSGPYAEGPSNNG